MKLKASHRKIVNSLLSGSHWLDTSGFGRTCRIRRGAWNFDVVRRSTIEEMRELGILVLRPVHSRMTLVVAEAYRPKE